MKESFSLVPQEAAFDEDVVVFLVGMRINSWWAIHEWLPVARAMPRMIKELEQSPEHGFLGAQFTIGNPLVVVQYWKSMEDLYRYARNKDGEHLPAWKAFNRNAKRTGRVGIFHEAYQVNRNSYRSTYINMPDYGLGKILGTRPHRHRPQLNAAPTNSTVGSPA